MGLINATCAVVLIIVSLSIGTKGQISTSCSASMISSFTPCLNFVTGSSSSRSSPTQDCCNSLKTLMADNMDCACLIITGNVPVSIPFINANLGIALPRACKSSLPLQCNASGVPLPPPGPVLFGPSPPPPASSHAPSPGPAEGHGHGHAYAPAPSPHKHTPKGSKAAGEVAPPPAESIDIAPAPKFPLGPTANPGIRPVVNLPSSASNLSLPSLLLMHGGPTDARLNLFKGRYAEGESRYNLSNGIIRKATELYISIAKKYGVHPVSLSIAFVLKHPLVASAVFGATKVWQLEEVLDGCRVELTPEIVAEIDQVHSAFPSPCP